MLDEVLVSCQQRGCIRPGAVDRVYKRGADFRVEVGVWCEHCWKLIVVEFEEQADKLDAMREAGVPKAEAVAAVEKTFGRESS